MDVNKDQFINIHDRFIKLYLHVCRLVPKCLPQIMFISVWQLLQHYLLCNPYIIICASACAGMCHIQQVFLINAVHVKGPLDNNKKTTVIYK